jgi:ribosomal-protein-alanine N-acetyltransferase
MSEAIGEVTKFCHAFVGLHRIQALVAIENIASIKCLIKAGFFNEGTLRQYILGNGIRDVAMLSSLKTEL